MSKAIRHGLNFVEPKNAAGLVQQVYAQIKNDLMTVPEPFSIHSPHPEILAGVWMPFREILETGKLSRGQKETIAVGISQINQCPWCVDSHTITLHATGHADIVSAVRGESGRQHQSMALLEWAKATRSPGDRALNSLTYSVAEMAEIIGTAVYFHYLNRVVNVMLIESPLPANGLVKNTMQRGLGFVFRRNANREYPAGDATGLLPTGPLPADMQWAAAAPAVGAAMSGFVNAIESARDGVVPTAVRQLVEHHVNRWNGEDIGLSRAWVDEPVQSLDVSERVIGKLALLTALASYQVDDQLVADFQATLPGDEKLVVTVAWASLTAARKIGSWLA